MWGDNTSTTTNTTNSGISDPVVKGSLDKLMTGLSAAQDAGPTYVGPGATTLGGQQAALSAAGNSNFANGINGALGQTAGLINSGGLTSGQSGNLNDTNSLNSLYRQMALNPGSTPEGQNLINTVMRDTNSAFNNSGLFGSDNNQTALSQGLTQGLGNLQSQYLGNAASGYNNAFNMGQQGVSNLGSLGSQLSSLYNTNQLPAGTQQAIGGAQDVAAQNSANKSLTLLSQLAGIGGLSAASAPTQTTATTTSPTQNPLTGLAGLLLGAL